MVLYYKLYLKTEMSAAKRFDQSFKNFGARGYNRRKIKKFISFSTKHLIGCRRVIFVFLEIGIGCGNYIYK
jgi:hypothetical protein